MGVRVWRSLHPAQCIRCDQAFGRGLAAAAAFQIPKFNGIFSAVLQFCHLVVLLVLSLFRQSRPSFGERCPDSTRCCRAKNRQHLVESGQRSPNDGRDWRNRESTSRTTRWQNWSTAEKIPLNFGIWKRCRCSQAASEGLVTANALGGVQGAPHPYSHACARFLL